MLACSVNVRCAEQSLSSPNLAANSVFCTTNLDRLLETWIARWFVASTEIAAVREVMLGIDTLQRRPSFGRITAWLVQPGQRWSATAFQWRPLQARMRCTCSNRRKSVCMCLIAYVTRCGRVGVAALGTISIAAEAELIRRAEGLLDLVIPQTTPVEKAVVSPDTAPQPLHPHTTNPGSIPAANSHKTDAPPAPACPVLPSANDSPQATSSLHGLSQKTTLSGGTSLTRSMLSTPQQSTRSRSTLDSSATLMSPGSETRNGVPARPSAATDGDAVAPPSSIPSGKQTAADCVQVASHSPALEAGAAARAVGDEYDSDLDNMVGFVSHESLPPPSQGRDAWGDRPSAQDEPGDGAAAGDRTQGTPAGEHNGVQDAGGDGARGAGGDVGASGASGDANDHVGDSRRRGGTTAGRGKGGEDLGDQAIAIDISSDSSDGDGDSDGDEVMARASGAAPAPAPAPAPVVVEGKAERTAVDAPAPAPVPAPAEMNGHKRNKSTRRGVLLTRRSTRRPPSTRQSPASQRRHTATGGTSPAASGDAVGGAATGGLPSNPVFDIRALAKVAADELGSAAVVDDSTGAQAASATTSTSQHSAVSSVSASQPLMSSSSPLTAAGDGDGQSTDYDSSEEATEGSVRKH